MKNRGTKEGDIQEKSFVKDFNHGSYQSFIDKYFYNKNNVLCVHVTTSQYSLVSKRKVKTKSDAYLIGSSDISESHLSELDFYLDEEIIKQFKYSIIDESGISIKLYDSSRYQIHKFTPDSFMKVFNNKYLGAAALIYSKYEKDFKKNKLIINAWGLEEDNFFNYFNNRIIGGINDGIHNYKIIQQYALNEIKNIINEDESISDLIFTGKGVYDSPYFATYMFFNNKLDIFKKTDFNVTQGSGRIKNPTIVIKP
ncbi:hypothetical protein N9V18_03595 [bacterium]|nr:hypothetical protein [bacterium]